MNKEFNVENLELIYDELAAQYMLLYMQTTTLLNEYFKDRNIEPAFPINYSDLAKWLGIGVAYKDLNYFRSRKQSQRFGEVKKNENGQYCITVDSTATRLEQRYAICYGIASYICNFQKNTHFYEQTKIPNSKESLLISIVTAFLIIPPDLFFEEVDNYMKSSKTNSVENDEMFLRVSPLIQMPYLKVICSFEHVKVLSCYLVYEKERIKEILQKSIDDEVLFKKVDDILNQECLVPKAFYI